MFKPRHPGARRRTAYSWLSLSRSNTEAKSEGLTFRQSYCCQYVKVFQVRGLLGIFPSERSVSCHPVQNETSMKIRLQYHPTALLALLQAGLFPYGVIGKS